MLIHSIEKTDPNLLKTKPHFEVLDGLRGIAALAIVAFHFMEVVYSDYSLNFIGHGFLAVDFFFCLSGFVIAYAYDDRIQKMGIIEFFKSRIIRLHPLILLGSVLGLLSFLYDPFGGPASLYSAGRTFLIFICSVFLIPFPVMTERFFNLFSFNAPAWSLFWEYVANIIYAFILYRIVRSYHILLILVSAVLLCYVNYKAGNLMGGWDGNTFWDGGARILYSFLIGLLIYRANWIIRNKLGFVAMSVLLSLAFLMPYSNWNWLTESLVVLFYFPLLIALGAGTESRPGFRKLCVFLGNISYPLYMTHYSVLWMFGNYHKTYKPATGQLSLIIVSGMILLLGVAYFFMVFYDIPVRRYLSDRRKK